jgi:two-component system, NarL family, invasion response regulator UvrY
MIRVLIADDHEIVRRGIIDIMSDDEEVVVVGQACSVPELLDLAGHCPCDVLILDVSMPGRGGIEALTELKRDHPRLQVLVLSVYAEEQYAIRALRAGAAGYLTKGAAPEELLKAVRRVASGRRYVTEALAERLAGAIQPDAEVPPHEHLSHREYHVLQAIAGGRSVGKIAEELSLSVKTVSTYRTRVLGKMGMRTNADLMRYAIDRHLVD